MKTRVHPVQVTGIRNSATVSSHADLLATEEPLAIRLGYGPVDNRQQQQLSVTMRTPGHDVELVTGFLFSEGIIRTYQDIISIRHCQQVELPAERENTMRVELSPSVDIAWENQQRYSYLSSSCGVCGKTSIEAVNATCPALPSTDVEVHPDVIHAAPDQLRQAQLIFNRTGGLHAAGLFSVTGKLRSWHEDVGRHNALDKLIGAALADGTLPLSQSFVLLSGRISFELVQKALMAGVPLLAAVGAPSSLAVTLAETYGMSLLGFVREQRFNIYTGQERVARCPSIA